MTITIDATYEQGVLKPSQPLPLREHEVVRVTVEPRSVAEEVGGTPTVTQPSLFEEILALAKELPEEVVAQLPTDGASQHDHYIYGTPKRPKRK